MISRDQFNRSYIVDIPGKGRIRRNRRFLRPIMDQEMADLVSRLDLELSEQLSADRAENNLGHGFQKPNLSQESEQFLSSIRIVNAATGIADYETIKPVTRLVRHPVTGKLGYFAQAFTREDPASPSERLDSGTANAKRDDFCSISADPPQQAQQAQEVERDVAARQRIASGEYLRTLRDDHGIGGVDRDTLSSVRDWPGQHRWWLSPHLCVNFHDRNPHLVRPVLQPLPEGMPLEAVLPEKKKSRKHRPSSRLPDGSWPADPHFSIDDPVTCADTVVFNYKSSPMGLEFTPASLVTPPGHRDGNASPPEIPRGLNVDPGFISNLQAALGAVHDHRYACDRFTSFRVAEQDTLAWGPPPTPHADSPQ